MSEAVQWALCAAIGILASLQILKYFGLIGNRAKAPAGQCAKCDAVSRMSKLLDSLDQEAADKH